MEKLIFLLIAVAGVSFANAQKIADKDVPAVVKSGLKKISECKGTEIGKRKRHYEAGFEVAKQIILY